MTISKTFMGYKSENGRVGVRNHVKILPVWAKTLPVGKIYGMEKAAADPIAVFLINFLLFIFQDI